ncbi:MULTISPECIES: alpha/beta hydrolase [unclassified Sphingobium]|uniref:alpha/beta hydrolase n=1 Tax=unclassified Sphingobium TaxID=2611147 RepID=UPI000D16E489|nr:MULTISPECIES: alpha/beta hydrolase [unclassified Sphingobium]PSO11531.1 alpha/beta hydrolase [Sphingobium sp. AEW4]TWD07824.1 acetyl esterase/lipase [Sphingobium sp. AEW010]TWD24906.1 acetyl esterase/lipase [Sphingobium sp. AEW013]TWD26676.1 acetyl esterase/lipase [Sphingobium sp. AEW001]
MTITRRMVIGAGAALATVPVRALAQSAPADEVIDLWPASPPGASGNKIARKVEDQSRDPAKPDRWISGIDRPFLVVRRPKHPNGTAMLVVPGGSYWFLSYDNEGVSQVDWLNAQGVTAFILMYRLPGEGWRQRENVPLQDAQRAMRLIRSRAQQFGIMPERVGVLGFSAGGHLAGSLATCHAEPVYAPVDAADGLSARPDVAGLIYPVISVDAPFTHEGSRAALLGQNPTEASRKARSVELRVTDDTSPVFLMHAADDGAVPVANSIALFQAMQAKARPVALHVFEHGGHGFGVRLPASEPASIWPTLFAAFAARHGILPPQQH